MIGNTGQIYKVLLIIITSIALTGCSALLNDTTIGNNLDDTVISASIKKEFIRRGFKKLYMSINVSVSEGRVLYVGNVVNQETIHEALDIAWSQNGVVEVINYLFIDDTNQHLNAKQYSQDKYISANVAAQLMFTQNVKSHNYTGVSHNSIVYLFGIARSKDEIKSAVDTVSRIAGVKKVITHMKIRDYINTPQCFIE